MSKWNLLIKIERKRRRLNEFALAPTLSDNKIVRVSKELDQLLNQYHALSREG
ncbi:aspartyl-phosphate phosphatase Spo0E family protein [Desulfosporosinus youngiae]|uniref:Spo0E like sporulation regulatory protein n=1 Tax=Desulfosporosinus youngiae DSM 17734 TaxID=768710 RepID=H5Y2Q7_9FIRM|nr:aspartyl-phosphate phosphatase Spo0E family protein [Desulfosporosinus youngiae]EHQ88320.1 Spo0E like sporulation regulatory protein [Desulfosporosinus youngiae DSM 17734]